MTDLSDRMMTRKEWRQVTIIPAVASIIYPGLISAVLADDPVSDEWAFRAAPYFWFTSLEGDFATIRGIPPADVDASFSDIRDNLNFGAMGYAEARRGRFGVGADLLYMDVSAEGGGPTPAFSKAELDLRAFIGTVNGFYRFVQEDTWTADALAGARPI